MDIQENYKDIEINGRKFRLNKLSAMTGTFMMVKLVGILVPMLDNINIDSLDTTALKDLNYTQISKSLCDLEEKELKTIQEKSLKVVEELLPAGPQKILGDYDKWGVENIEFDMALVLNLTVQSIWFNVESFLKGSPLSSLLKGLNISLPNSQM